MSEHDVMNEETIDTSDVDRYIGQEIGGGVLKEPITVTDIRRWVMALDYYNPIHFDEDEAARRAPAGEIVAPLSFIANCTMGHGAVPAIAGRIENSHVVFGGDEWWFYGPDVRPGDRIHTRRTFAGYDIANTKFAGPVMFSHGDTVYINQRGEAIAKQRCTMGRYVVEYARKRGFFDQYIAAPEFTREQLAGFRKIKADWLASGAEGKGPGAVKAGDALPPRLIGPHTAVSFTKEYSALLFTAWGSVRFEGEWLGNDAGWIDEMQGESDDPALQASQDDGPASAHTDLDKARAVGIPRNYGYGSSMGAWTLDYAQYWAGDAGFIRHARIEYRSPVFEHDIALINGEVQELRYEPVLGCELAVVRIRMTNQDDVLLASGYVEVQLRPV